MNDTPSCRLCFNELSDFNRTSNYLEIYGIFGISGKCAEKIKIFMHLDVANDAELMTKTICILCWEKLDAFSEFYEKVNEIQERHMKERIRQIDVSKLPSINEHEMQLAISAIEEPVIIKVESVENDHPEKPDQILNDSKLFTTILLPFENEQNPLDISTLGNPVTVKAEPCENDALDTTVTIQNYGKSLEPSPSATKNPFEIKYKRGPRKVNPQPLPIELDLVPGDWRIRCRKLAKYKNYLRKCCVENCGVTHGHGIQLHRFSTQYKYCGLWLRNCGIKEPIPEKLFVCELHFESKYIRNNELVKSAVPTLELSISPGTTVLKTYRKKSS